MNLSNTPIRTLPYTDTPDEPTDIHLTAGEILTLVGDGDTSWNWWDVRKESNGETGCKFPLYLLYH